MKLLKDRDYLPFLLEAIGNAQKEIDARIFLIDPGLSRRSPVLKILKALQARARSGARVSIFTENMFRKKASGRRLVKAARKMGLEIQWDVRQTVLHEKTVRIDDEILILGSHNWTAPSLAENREISIQILSRVPLLNSKEFVRSLLRSIRKAKKEITIASFDLDESSDPEEFGSKLTRALISAKERGVKVQMLLDASQLREPRTGEIFYHYRGERKAEELAHAGVLIYYDSRTTLFHAKIAVLDDRWAYIGSQNLGVRNDAQVFEATVRLDSQKIASELNSYLTETLRDAFPFHEERAQVKGLPIPVSFLEKNGVFSRMFKRHAEKPFRLYVSLLREAQKMGLMEFERNWPSSLHKARRLLVEEYRVLRHERGIGVRPSRSALVHPETGRPFAFPDKDFFMVPDSFFDFGWFGRLGHDQIFLFWIQLAEGQHSSQSPYWSMRTETIAKKFGITVRSIVKANLQLQRWNLIEVIRDPNIIRRDRSSRPNRYRVNPTASPIEQGLAKKKMLEELSMNRKALGQAQKFADLLNEPHDLDVIRKFLLLIDHYGVKEVEKAVRITARFKFHFALRNVNHTAGILRNWSLGISKQGAPVL